MSALRIYEKGKNAPTAYNFNSMDFDCPCADDKCTKTVVSLKHLENLQKLREKLNKNITILNGYYCADYLNNSDNPSNSRHLHADAAIITVKGMTPENIANIAKSIFNGVGIHDTYVYVDSRKSSSLMWDFRRKK